MQALPHGVLWNGTCVWFSYCFSPVLGFRKRRSQQLPMSFKWGSHIANSVHYRTLNSIQSINHPSASLLLYVYYRNTDYKSNATQCSWTIMWWCSHGATVGHQGLLKDATLSQVYGDTFNVSRLPEVLWTVPCWLHYVVRPGSCTFRQTASFQWNVQL